MKRSLWNYLSLILFTLFVLGAEGIFLSVAPIKEGDYYKYSNINNLLNCVSYETLKEHIILVIIKSGEKIPSQKLNLNIFDSESNIIRSESDISQDLNLILTNLVPSKQNSNSDVNRKGGLLEKLLRIGSKSDKTTVDEILTGNIGKSFIYVCFDNVFSDKSWSFHPQNKDLELEVELKTMKSINKNNYDLFSKLLLNNKKQDDDRGGEALERKVNMKNQDQEIPINQERFEKSFLALQSELDDVVDALLTSDSILSTLMEHEHRLRDTNEAIFVSYTNASITFLILIGAAGAIQIIYLKCYLKKRKVF